VRLEDVLRSSKDPRLRDAASMAFAGRLSPAPGSEKAGTATEKPASVLSSRSTSGESGSTEERGSSRRRRTCRPSSTAPRSRRTSSGTRGARKVRWAGPSSRSSSSTRASPSQRASRSASRGEGPGRFIPRPRTTSRRPSTGLPNDQSPGWDEPDSPLPFEDEDGLSPNGSCRTPPHGGNYPGSKCGRFLGPCAGRIVGPHHLVCIAGQPPEGSCAPATGWLPGSSRTILRSRAARSASQTASPASASSGGASASDTGTTSKGSRRPSRKAPGGATRGRCPPRRGGPGRPREVSLLRRSHRDPISHPRRLEGRREGYAPHQGAPASTSVRMPRGSPRSGDPRGPPAGARPPSTIVVSKVAGEETRDGSSRAWRRTGLCPVSLGSLDLQGRHSWRSSTRSSSGKA